MPEQEKRMTWAFAEYLIIIVAVNGILAVSNLTHWGDWGKLVAELVLGLMALPVQELVGVNKRIADIAQSAADTKADLARQHAEAVAEQERAADRENARVIELRKLELDAQAAENDKRRAERAEKAKAKPAKVSETYPKDRRKLTQAQKEKLSRMTAAEISALVGVSLKSGQNWLKEFEKEKNA